MRQGDDPRQASGAAAAGGVRRSAGRLPTVTLGVVLAATPLAGCDPAPMPEAALLKPLPAPRCDTRANVGPHKEAALGAPVGSGGGDAAQLRKLDYEAQCYRHAEMIARHRLGRLQASVQEAVRAAKPAPSATP